MTNVFLNFFNNKYATLSKEVLFKQCEKDFFDLRYAMTIE